MNSENCSLTSARSVAAWHKACVSSIEDQRRSSSQLERLRQSLAGLALAKSTGGGGAPAVELREYGFGGQILAALGARKIILLTNTGKRLIGLSGFNLDVIEQRKF